MLWAAISLISTFSIVKSQTCSGGSASVNSGENNYALDYFASALAFPFALDKCNAADFVPGVYRQYSCLYMNDTDSWVVERNTYTSSSCTGTAVETVHLTNPDSFYCEGSNSYATLTLSYNDDTCAVKSVVHAALGVCVQSMPLFSQFYCASDTSAKVNLFLTDYFGNETTTQPYENCDSRLYCLSWNLGSTCGLITNTPVTIYGYISKCEDPSTTTSTQSSAVTVSFSILALVSSLVVALLH